MDDAVLGDRDGVAIIPSAVLDDVLVRAESKRASEREAHDLLKQGLSVAEVYERLNVL